MMGGTQECDEDDALKQSAFLEKLKMCWFYKIFFKTWLKTTKIVTFPPPTPNPSGGNQLEYCQQSYLEWSKEPRAANNMWVSLKVNVPSSVEPSDHYGPA